MATLVLRVERNMPRLRDQAADASKVQTTDLEQQTTNFHTQKNTRKNAEGKKPWAAENELKATQLIPPLMADRSSTRMNRKKNKQRILNDLPTINHSS